jgi:hypothetical protein
MTTDDDFTARPEKVRRPPVLDGEDRTILALGLAAMISIVLIVLLCVSVANHNADKAIVKQKQALDSCTHAEERDVALCIQIVRAG